MKLNLPILAAFAACLLGSCSGNEGIRNTDTGIIVEVGPDGRESQINVDVIDEKIIRLTAVSPSAMKVEKDDTGKAEAGGTPFNTTITPTTAGLDTRLEGVLVNRETSEISFLDSLGNTLLTVMPLNINPTKTEGSNLQPGEFKLIFSQNDVISVSTDPDSDPDTVAPFIATDGYNILWRVTQNGSKEEYYLIFGEEINYYLHRKDNIP